MRTANHPNQHSRAEQRRLEHLRAYHVRELAKINAKLRQRTPQARDDDWDFDPRTVAPQQVEASHG